MATLSFDAALCAHTRTKLSRCNECITVCPKECFVLEDEKLGIDYSKCVDCGACSGVCPSEALNLDNFKGSSFFFSQLEEKEVLISCKKNVPCIAALHVEYLLSLTLMKQKVCFDMGHCDACELAHTCKPVIEANAEEVNYLCEALESDACISLENIAYEEQHERRDLFRSLRPENLAASKAAFEKNIAHQEQGHQSSEVTNEITSRIRSKEHLSDKRKLLLSVLKRTSKPSTFHVVEGEALSFTSSKLIDVTACNACQICYRLCPTKALSSDARNSKIDFDPFLCIKCGICEDVCDVSAIECSPSYNLKEFFEPSLKNLVSFQMKRCGECDNLFASLEGETVCKRCMTEEESARELWGLA